MKVALVKSLAPFVLVGAVLAPPSASAETPMTGGGCPPAYELISVSAAVAAGYEDTPPVVDAHGNGDGIVCRHAYPDPARSALCGVGCPVPVLYVWNDNKAALAR